MALLPQDRQSQVMLLITIGMLALGYTFWNYWATPTGQEIETAQAEIKSMEAVIAQAKSDLASGTVEDLRRKVEEYTALLSVMRRLVPEKNEVPALIDDISTKAKVRGVTIGRIEPQAVEAGPPFDTYRYRLEIIGDYDQLGEVLSDNASPPRIILPQDGVPKAAAPQGQKPLGGTPGAPVQAPCGIRPLLSDLRLVGIYYDGRYPARSVAVLRDVTNSKVYRVKPGNIIGRLKATTIRPREIVFTVQEFGFERQESLQLAKQEVTP